MKVGILDNLFDNRRIDVVELVVINFQDHYILLVGFHQNCVVWIIPTFFLCLDKQVHPSETDFDTGWHYQVLEELFWISVFGFVNEPICEVDVNWVEAWRR